MDLVARVQGILLKPKDEWVKIKEESLPISVLFTSYAVLLAAIPAVCKFIGLILVGRRIPWRLGLIPVSFGRALFSAIFLYLMTLVSVYVLGIIINALAPTFSSKQNQENAMKIAVFSMSPIWVAGVFNIIPFLSWLGIIGIIYGIYLFYFGFTSSLMETPPDKVIGYFVVCIVTGIILFAILVSINNTLILASAISKF